MLAQIIVNCLITGAIYSLVASGFSLIYSTNRFFHFAHGATIASGAYMLYFLFSVLGLAFWISAIMSVALSALLGVLLNFFVYRQFRKRKANNVIIFIASFTLLIIAESLISILLGADVKTIDYIAVSRGIEFAGAFITPLQVSIISISIATFLSLRFFMRNTRLGKAIRAVSDNKEVAEIVGISSEKIYNWSFFIGSGTAGMAGVLIALEHNLGPMMGTHLMIKGFIATIIGGIGSVPGAMLGAFLLGSAENIGVWFLPLGYKDAISFLILSLFLLIRPRGILGIKKGMNK